MTIPVGDDESIHEAFAIELAAISGHVNHVADELESEAITNK